METTKTAKSGKAYVLLFLTFFFWGSVYVVSKYAMNTLTPATVGCLRYALALIPLSILYFRSERKKIERADWKYFLIIGGLGYYLTVLLNMTGIGLAGASMTSLLNSLMPVSITILAALLLKERITPIKIVCLVLAIVGAIIITSGAADKGSVVGILLVLFAVLTWSFASVTMRRVSMKYGAITTATVGVAVSMALHIPTAVVSTVRAGGLHLTWGAVLSLVYMAFACTALAQLTWNMSLTMLDASTCSLFYPLQPLFSVLLGSIFLKERFTTSFFIGAALIMADVVVNCLYQARKEKRVQNCEAKADAEKPSAEQEKSAS